MHPLPSVTAAQAAQAALAVLVELDVLQALLTSNVTVAQAQVAQLVETTWA